VIERDVGIPTSGYHRYYYSDRDWQTYSGLLARIVRYSHPGPILDLGAGCGYLLEAANRWGIPCIGLEGSPDAIEMAKERFPTIDIRLHRLSNDIPFHSNCFQTVVLNQVIEHLESETMRHTLLEAYRILRPGGMMLITSPSCFNRLEWSADPTHINLLSPSALRKILTEYQYEKIQAFDSPLPFFGPGRVGYGIMTVIFRLLPFDQMSSTANAMAYKSTTS
jgi:SAM-dependent methyltransferase